MSCVKKMSKDSVTLEDVSRSAEDGVNFKSSEERRVPKPDVTWWSPYSAGGDLGTEQKKGLVKLLVGRSGSQQTLTCDKKKLTSNSPYFAQRIIRDMDSDLPEWVILHDADPVALDIILKSISDGQFPAHLPFEMTLRVLQTAKEFEMSQVANHFRNHVKNNVKSVDGAVELLEVANRLKDVELRRMALEYLVPRFSALIKSKTFLRLGRSSICALLRNNNAVAKSEHLIFEAVIKWAESECRKVRIGPINYNHIRTMLGDIIHLIRFPTMKPDYFRRNVLPMAILNGEDCELLEYYWKLLETDSIAASAMSLPFEKSSRTGTRFTATFFSRKASNKNWTVPTQQWMTLKIRSECSIKLHSVLMYGTPEKRGSTIPVKTILLRKVVGEKGRGRYRAEKAQDAIVRMTHEVDGSCRLELDSPLLISAGRKYKLRICFMKTLADNSEGSLNGSGWINSSANCGKEQGSFKILVKKEKGGDFLFHTLDFFLAYSYDKERDTFFIPKEDIGHHNQKDFLNCSIV